MASQNVQIVKLNDGREVCLSYGVPVAAYVPGRGYIRRNEYFSVTSSRHANSFAGGDAGKIGSAEFLKLIAPVADAGRGRS